MTPVELVAVAIALAAALNIVAWATTPRQKRDRRPRLATAHAERHNHRLGIYVRAQRELEADGVQFPTTGQIYDRAWDLEPPTWLNEEA